MKARSRILLKLLMGMPLASAYSLDGCTADAIRDAADELNDTADRIDDDDPDLGDWLSDEIEDW